MNGEKSITQNDLICSVMVVCVSCKELTIMNNIEVREYYTNDIIDCKSCILDGFLIVKFNNFYQIPTRIKWIVK